MTDWEREIRLNFMKYILMQWLKTASLAPLMQEKPNVAYSVHLQDNYIAWKCFVSNQNPSSVMSAKNLQAYLANMRNDLYLLAKSAFNLVIKEYERLDAQAVELQCKAVPLVLKENQNTITYGESMQLNAYRFKFNQLYQQAQKCAYVANWTKFEIVTMQKHKDCLVFELVTG